METYLVFGQRNVLLARVIGVAAGSFTPTGTITLLEDGKPVGTATILSATQPIAFTISLNGFASALARTAYLSAD